MERTTYIRIALVGGIWFALVAGVGFLLLMSALPKPFAPSNLVNISGQLNFALLIFALPAGIVGFALANRIAHTAHSIRVIGLGTALVLATNLLAGVGLAMFGSHFVSLRLFLEQAAVGAVGFLLLDL